MVKVATCAVCGYVEDTTAGRVRGAVAAFMFKSKGRSIISAERPLNEHRFRTISARYHTYIRVYVLADASAA